MTSSLKEHWNKAYEGKETTDLGWYESDPYPSIKLIEDCDLPKDAPIVDIGSGASTLIPHLLKQKYQNISALDISELALDKAKSLLSEEEVSQVRWIVGDITNSAVLQELKNVALWHDRAVFHFLIEEEDRVVYRSNLQKTLVQGGFLIIATFALDGADKCSGLPIQRYSVESLSEFFGDGFKLIESLVHTYQMPSGALRPFTYVRLQKI